MPRARITLRVRERRPDLPNFRDHGLMVDRPLLKLVGSLQKRHGYAWASERSLRQLIHQDTGHCPGVSTIPKALRRLERLGYVESRWIYRSGVIPDGDLAMVGCLRLRLAIDRRDRRAIASRARKADHRANVSKREEREVPAPDDFKAAMKEIARGAPDAPSPDQRERDYEANVARSREWAQRLAEAELEELERELDES